MPMTLRRYAQRIKFHVFVAHKGRTAPFTIFDVQQVPCKNWREVHWSFRFARNWGGKVVLVSKTYPTFPINPKPTA